MILAASRLVTTFALAGLHPFRCRDPISPGLRLRVGYLRSVMSPLFCLDFDFTCEDFLKKIEEFSRALPARPDSSGRIPLRNHAQSRGRGPPDDHSDRSTTRSPPNPRAVGRVAVA
jgi:hypothetical protein